MKINKQTDALIGQLVDSIDKLNSRLADLAPCPSCDGSGEHLPRGSADGQPCPDCWGRGWDLEQLEDDDATDK